MIQFIKDFFGPKKEKSEPVATTTAVKTAPLSEEQLQTVSKEEMSFHPTQILMGTAQSVGVQRDHNEDTIFAMHAILADGNTDLPFGIFIVADGMGGHQNGEAASGEAARVVSEYVLSKIFLPVLSSDNGSGESIHEILENGVQEAQKGVVRNAPGGGTTLTAVLLLGEQVTIAHVGDSRAYFVYPDGRLRAMTQDHSLVRRLQDQGIIDEQEAHVHPQRNVLYRALGQPEPFRPDINTHSTPKPGFLLVCSDGLWGLVAEADMFQIINTAPNPSVACHQLIEAANAAGGPDNISAILVQFM